MFFLSYADINALARIYIYLLSQNSTCKPSSTNHHDKYILAVTFKYRSNLESSIFNRIYFLTRFSIVTVQTVSSPRPSDASAAAAARLVTQR